MLNKNILYPNVDIMQTCKCCIKGWQQELTFTPGLKAVCSGCVCTHACTCSGWMYMYTHMYVHAVGGCTCTHTCMYMQWVDVHVHTHACTCSGCMYMYTHMHVHAVGDVHVHTHACTSSGWMYMYTCMYIHVPHAFQWLPHVCP